MINIFVEGDNDRNFVGTLIKHFNITQNPYKIICTDGWEKIKFLKNTFQLNKDLGGENYIIFDADNNPVQRRNEILSLINTPLIDDIFLFPNNTTNGNIESLLIQIMNPIQNTINNCFDNYRVCIGSLGAPYQVPDDKSKVFAYLSALGKEYNVKSRNYSDLDAWNLSHKLIQGFVIYLQGVLK